MNYNEIKNQLGVNKVQFQASKDAEGVVSDKWMKAWVNRSHVLSIPMDVFEHIQETKGDTKDNLMLSDAAPFKGEDGREIRHQRLLTFSEDVVAEY